MPRDKAKQRQWRREHYKTIVGCRVKEAGEFYQQTSSGLSRYWVEPTDFLVGKSRVQPFTIYETDYKVHVPRSLCNRATITIDKKTGEIKGRNNAFTRNK